MSAANVLLLTDDISAIVDLSFILTAHWRTTAGVRLTGTQNFADYVYVDTHDVSVKENGYLVAGVSGYGSATKALILVISAVIK